MRGSPVTNLNLIQPIPPSTSSHSNLKQHPTAQSPPPYTTTMAETVEPPLKTYRGNCHCTTFVYEFESPEIQTARECNCSICYKKGYLWVSPSAGSYRVVKGDEAALTAYTFGSGKWVHKFCGICATPLMVVNEEGGRRGINVSFSTCLRGAQGCIV